MKKMPFIAGNWKSTKTLDEAKAWFDTFLGLVGTSGPITGVTAVLCPGYTLLPYAAERIRSAHLGLELGGQDVSAFGAGAFTGEINAAQLKEFAGWTIIGHSERRSKLGEKDDLLTAKVKEALSAGLKVIYCVQDETISVPEGVSVIAYEPPWAISAVSGGVAQDAKEAGTVCANISAAHPGVPVIYGGSTTPENVGSFSAQPSVSGVLPGGASCDPVKFFAMIQTLATGVK